VQRGTRIGREGCRDVRIGTPRAAEDYDAVEREIQQAAHPLLFRCV
jgi:hypothetical protein